RLPDAGYGQGRQHRRLLIRCGEGGPAPPRRPSRHGAEAGTTREEFPMAPLLKAEGITKRFPGVTALDDVSITLNPGEIHCIVGENGAGKSTLVKILTGLYKPDEGTLTIMGETGGGNASSVIAYVPQEINLFDHL